MAQTVSWHFGATATALLLCLPGVLGCAAQDAGLTAPQRRASVETNLQSLNQGLRAGTWAKVERFFSPAYHEGYGELRDRLAQRFRSEQITDLQFTLNRVLESDGLVNAQVRWRKAWVDKLGKPGKSSGLSEFILKPEAGAYRISRTGGDPLF